MIFYVAVEKGVAPAPEQHLQLLVITLHQECSFFPLSLEEDSAYDSTDNGWNQPGEPMRCQGNVENQAVQARRLDGVESVALDTTRAS